jgi:hypothetical protein
MDRLNPPVLQMGYYRIIYTLQSNVNRLVYFWQRRRDILKNLVKIPLKLLKNREISMKPFLECSTFLSILFLLFVTSAPGKSKKPIYVSPVIITWDAQAKAFNADYTVTNNSKKDRELAAIITFQSTTVRWWRGGVLPVVKAGSSGSFAVSFPAYILLKNDYREISVKLYGGKNYKPFLDKSSNYQSLSSKVQTDENLKVVFASSVKDASAGPANQPETLVLGKKGALRSLLISSMGEGARLKRITGSGAGRQEELVAEFAAKKAEMADLAEKQLPVKMPLWTTTMATVVGRG